MELDPPILRQTLPWRGDLRVVRVVLPRIGIGDDKIQKRSRGYVFPKFFTDGTSEQRMRWFLKAFKSGDMTHGDAFNTKEAL